MEDQNISSSNKKKHKKEKRKHKKHSGEKSDKDKSKKHKKHKKSKHKDYEKSQKNGDYTPEKKDSTVISNGKVSVEKLEKVTAVNIITEELDVDQKKLIADTASSESEVQDVDCDSVDIDLDLIEADMDLEELMKQKELLQAQLAKAESEGITSPPEITNEVKVADEVILLDDSDEPEAIVPEITKRKRSKSRDRKMSIRPKEDLKRRRTHSRERLYREHERDKQIRK